MEFLKEPLFWTLLIASLSLLWSACNFIFGKLVANKILGNDIKHITTDITELKDKDEKRNENIYCELKKIHKRLGSIDRLIIKRDTLCGERHSKYKKK